MQVISRRALLRRGAFAGTTLLAFDAIRRPLFGRADDRAKFTMNLSCGSIGVRADQKTAMRLARKHGFESVAADAKFLAGLDAESNEKLLQELEDSKLVWGAAGLPVQFNRDERTFAEGLKQLPRLATALERAGVTRVGTWLSPAHSELTYRNNFRRHTQRLRDCAKILGDHGLRLGLEYIGPKTLWASSRHSFIHTMAETKELIAEIGRNNVGFVLDSWHWYTAHETMADLRTLQNRDVVACDLNDAPPGIPVDDQIDSRRELPAATGVIALKEFLTVLIEIGYDGPIRAEPFNQSLNEMEDDMAVAETAKAMRKAFALTVI